MSERRPNWDCQLGNCADRFLLCDLRRSLVVSDRWSAATTASVYTTGPRSSGLTAGGGYHAGVMLLFSRNKLSGSYLFLASASLFKLSP